MAGAVGVITPPAIVVHEAGDCSVLHHCSIGAAQRGLLAHAGGQVEASVWRTVAPASDTLHAGVLCHTVRGFHTLLALKLLQTEPDPVLPLALETLAPEASVSGQRHVHTLHQEPKTSQKPRSLETGPEILVISMRVSSGCGFWTDPAKI